MKLIKEYIWTLSILLLLLLTSCEDPIYNVSVLSGEGGSATISSNQVMPGWKVILTATADERYVFANWTVDGTVISTENPCEVVVNKSTQFKANFEKMEYCGHEYVDLGLSVKWATCNIGSSSPEGRGRLFEWGETTSKAISGWNNYKYCQGTSNALTKYCTDSKLGIKDGKTTLELLDDAAYMNWGGPWRMPTSYEFAELKNSKNCEWKYVTQKGVRGFKITSNINGASIFLPSETKGTHEYWLSTLWPYNNSYAYCLGSSYTMGRPDRYEMFITSTARCSKLYIRPVCK